MKKNNLDLKSKPRKSIKKKIKAVEVSRTRDSNDEDSMITASKNFR